MAHIVREFGIVCHILYGEAAYQVVDGMLVLGTGSLFR